MNLGPQKPRILRPTALLRPTDAVSAETPTAPVAPVTQAAPASKLGLWVSLGFHACLIAAACTATLMSPGEKGKGDDDTAGDRGEFEMRISNREPQASEPESPTAPESLPTPQVPAPQASLFALEDLPALRAQSLFEPMTSVIATKPSPPSAPPTAGRSTEKSPGPAKTQTGKSGGKKGSGEGKRVKRPPPASPPQLLSSPPPRYPATVRAAKKAGKVSVLIQVRANGSAASTSVYRSSGNSQLDQAAVAAARSWKFSQTPSLEAGATIAVVVQVTFAL